MKFVCTECDEPMKFDTTTGLDDDGSLPVTFRCPSCDWGVTMLINPQETQMVRSLGVKIGGSDVPAPAMEMMRTFVKTGDREAGSSSKEGAGGKCPFSHMVNELSPEE